MPSPSNVLVVQPYGIGDLLFITPVLRALRLMPGIQRVDLLLGSRTREIVQQNPHVDEIFSIDKDLFHRQKGLETLKDIWALGKILRKRKYDLLLDYSFRDEYAVLGRLFLNIPRRAGYQRGRRGSFHNIRLPIPAGFEKKHVTDYACDLAERAGVAVKDRYMEFYQAADAAGKARDTLKQNGIELPENFIVVSPGGGESWGKNAHFKRWQPRFFSDLINRLSARYAFNQVFILGSPGEKNIGDEVARGCSISCHNVMGMLTLEESASVVSLASFFIGNDGGLVHLAHALRVPVIGFYGPVDPQVYGPYPESSRSLSVVKDPLECRPCYRNFRYRQDCKKRECLTELFPDEAEKIILDSNISQYLIPRTPQTAGGQ